MFPRGDRVFLAAHDGDAAVWAAEVERRIEEIESGRATLIPAAESIDRARAAIK